MRGVQIISEVTQNLPERSLIENLQQYFGPTRSTDRLENIYIVRDGMPVLLEAT